MRASGNSPGKRAPSRRPSRLTPLVRASLGPPALRRHAVDVALPEAACAHSETGRSSSTGRCNAQPSCGHDPAVDTTRFEQLYRDNWQALFAYARRRTENVDVAADVVADVFTVAWRRADDIPDGPQARLWLFGVARRTVANSARGESRRGRLHARLTAAVAEASIDPAEVVASADVVARVRAAVRALPPNDRELLLLVAWDGLSPTDAAAVLGIAPSLARVRLRRARIRLRRLLDPDRQRDAATGHVYSSGKSPVHAREFL